MSTPIVRAEGIDGSDPEVHQTPVKEAGALEGARLAGRCITNNLGYLGFVVAIVGITALATVLALTNMTRKETDWAGDTLLTVTNGDVSSWMSLAVGMTVVGVAGGGFAIAVHLKRRKLEEELEALQQQPDDSTRAKRIANHEALITKLRILDHAVAAVALACLTVAVVTWITVLTRQQHVETQKTWVEGDVVPGPESREWHNAHDDYGPKGDFWDKNTANCDRGVWHEVSWGEEHMRHPGWRSERVEWHPAHWDTHQMWTWREGYWQSSQQSFMVINKSGLEKWKIVSAIAASAGVVGTALFYGSHALIDRREKE